MLSTSRTAIVCRLSNANVVRYRNPIGSIDVVSAGLRKFSKRVVPVALSADVKL